MASEDKVQVLHAWFSMFGMRVLIALKQKGVVYEVQLESLPNKSKLLLESNPVHKSVPVLIHNGKPVCESSIIVQYIDEAWPSATAPLLPNDPYERAIARFWADYADKTHDAGMRLVRSRDDEQREAAKKDLIEVLETLDKALQDVSRGGPFFGGQHIGFVDITFASFLCWFEAYESLGEFKIWEASKCPHLSKWARTVVEVPCVKEALATAPPHKVKEAVYGLRQRLLQAEA